MYCYGANNPVRYTDPDGRKFNTANLNKECLRRFDIAISELRKTDRGNLIISILENSDTIFEISHNNSRINKYHQNSKKIEWDSNKVLCKDFHLDESNKVVLENSIDAITLLLHELGHAYQDECGELPNIINYSQQENLEDKNIEENENPVAQERGNYKRKNHCEFMLIMRKTTEEFLKKETE